MFGNSSCQSPHFSNAGGSKQVTVSVETLDTFDPGTYQRLLNNMVSRISKDVRSGRIDTNISLFGEPKERHPPATDLIRTQTLLQSPSEIISSSHRSMMSLEDIESPSTFSISVADPLHFLGVTPTNQSGELLQACKHSIFTPGSCF
jgi:hypothetical protein